MGLEVSTQYAATLDGCYLITKDSRTFLNSAGNYDPSLLDHDTCARACGNQDYAFAALQVGQHCLCTDSTPDSAAKQIGETLCNTPCTGDSAQDCGSADYILVYSVSATIASVQLDATTVYTVGNKAPVNVAQVEGTDLKYSYDFGDGSALSSDNNHVYTTLGDYIVSVTVQNDKYVAFDSIPVQVDVAVAGVTVICPFAAGVASDFDCVVEVLHGNNPKMTPKFDASPDLVAGNETNVGVPTYFSMGYVSQDPTLTSPASSEIQTSTSPFVWVIPGAETLETSQLVSIEAFISEVGDGTLNFVIYNPVCVSPSNTYCPTDNVCRVICDFDWTMRSRRTQETCSGLEYYCLTGTSCSTSGTCPAESARYVTDTTDNPRAEYEVVQVIPVTGLTSGHYFHDLTNSPIKMSIGYVLGFETKTGGAQIAHEASLSGSPVEFQLTGSSASVGSTLTMPSPGFHIRHHVRGTTVDPAKVWIQHAFPVAGTYKVEAFVYTETGPEVANSDNILVQEIVEGLQVEVDNAVLRLEETVTVSVRITGGVGVNYTWNWGDDSPEEVTVRQAATYEDADINTHVYTDRDGPITITVLAMNFANNETATAEVNVQYPIHRDHFVISSNSPQPHEPGRDNFMNFTVTINLPANENLGTGAFFAVSTNYFENSTIHFISVTNDNAIESFPHKIRFSGTYIARVNISNKISSEVYEFEVMMIEPIAGLYLEPMYKPPLPLDGVEQVGFGPARNTFPLNSDVVFVPRVATGTNMVFTLTYDDGSPNEASSELKIPHRYSATGSYIVRVNATNALGGLKTSIANIILHENIDGIEATMLATAKTNFTKPLSVKVGQLGTDSCLMVNYGDGAVDLFGNLAMCQTRYATTAVSLPPIGADMILYHEYDPGNYKLSTFGFNLVSDSKGDIFFAVSYASCDAPRLHIRDGHPDFRGPGIVRLNAYTQVQGVTTVNCTTVSNTKEWTMEEIDPMSGKTIVGSSKMLTGRPVGDPYYLPDQNTAEINIPPYFLDVGLWKFRYTVRMITAGMVNFTAFVDEYIEVRSSPLQVQIIEGQTTSKVVGFRKTFLLRPGELSRDPDLPNADDDQGFDNIEYFCKRVHEPWKLNDNRQIQRSPNISFTPVPGSLDEGGCFGTGNGLLDYRGKILEFDTEHCLPNMTFELMVFVTKGSRVSNASIWFTVKIGDPPQPTISCSGGTLFQQAYSSYVVNPTDDFRLKAGCEGNCYDTSYEWQMEFFNSNNSLSTLTGWQDYATGELTNSLFINKDVFKIREDIRIYIFTLLLTSYGQQGKAHMMIALNEPPRDGTCTISPTDTTDVELVSIDCVGWEDSQGISSYEFYIVVQGNTANKVVDFGAHGKTKFHSPVGMSDEDYMVEFQVQIYDSLGATTIYPIGKIKVRPEATNGTNTLSGDYVEKTTNYFSALAAEGNSRAINNELLTESSKLNELRAVDAHRLNGTNATATEDPTEFTDEDHQRGRTQRAYIRLQMAELVIHTSMDSLFDVLNCASAITVLTEAYDELSHGTLEKLATLGEIMVKTLRLLAPGADQKTISKVAKTCFEVFVNLLSGSATTIDDPISVLDKLEVENATADYTELNRRIAESSSVTESVTTTESPDVEVSPEKKEKARQLVARVELLVEEVSNILKENKLPGEPASTILTKQGTTTLKKAKAGDLKNSSVKEGDGEIVVPDFCAITEGECEDETIIDVQSSSRKLNSFNYMSSSERVSKSSNVMSLKYFKDDGGEIPIDNSRQEFELYIPRPDSETPQCTNYEQNFNTTSQTGMSLHTIQVPYDQTTVTLEVIPDFFNTTQYALLVRYKHPPKWNETDHKWIVPYNISLGTSPDAYSIHLNQSYIGNNTGTYYLGVIEIPQEPQRDNPLVLFDDNLTPEELMHDILKLRRVANFSSNYTLCVYVSGCVYFNNDTQEWTTDGVRIGPKSTKDMTQCFSTHLTDFASTWIVPPAPLDFQFIFNNAGFLDNLTIYITTIAVYVLFFFIFIWSRRKDKKDCIMQGLTPMPDNKSNHKYLYEIAVMTGQWKDSGTDSKVNFILSGEDDETEVRVLEDDQRPILRRGCVDRFVMAVPRPLGTLNYMRLWHDNSGKGSMQSWYVQYIAVRDLQTRERFYFITNRWFSLVEDDGQVDRLIPVAGKEQMQGFSHLFSSHTRKNLSDGHLWFSIFLRPVGSRFTRVQRTACCMMALWLEMLVNIMFYDFTPSSASAGALNLGPFRLSTTQISIGLQSSLIVFPITLLVVQVFRKARARTKTKSHRQIIKEQQKAKQQKYRVEKEDTISQSHVIMESKATNQEDNISTRSEANLLDNQVNSGTHNLTLNTMASQPSQKARKKKKCALPWWSIIIGWIICILSIATATTFVIFYSLEMQDEKCKEWLSSLVITFITGIMCTQPIKILLVAIFISLIIKSPNVDEEGGEEEEEEEDCHLGKDEMWLHDLSSPLQRNSSYKPPNCADLERLREQRIKELKMYNIIREICFYIVFLWTLMVVSYSNVDPLAFFMKDQYTKVLNNADGLNSFDKVSGVKRFWQWVDTGMLPNLYAGKMYNGQVDPQQEGYFGDRQSFILGKVVMRQVRVKPGLCDVHKSFDGLINECNEGYSVWNEDTRHYGKGWTEVNYTLNPWKIAENYRYADAEELNGYPFLGRHSLYLGGGYVIVIDGSEDHMRNIFRRLYEETWIDKYTRAVFLEFSCYNPAVNLFGVAEFVVEFLTTGAAEPMQRVDIIRLLTYSQGFGLVRIICEVTFFCFIAFFIIKEIRNARREKRLYLKDFWNWTECGIIVFSIAAAVVYFYRMYITSTILEQLKDGGYRYIKLQYVAYWNALLGYMLGFILFLSTLKFLKLLRFNRRIGVLSSTIQNCSSDLMYFGIMFGIVFFAFAIAFYLIFNKTMYDFSDFIFTCENLSSAILGKFKFEELVMANPLLGPIFFFLFMGSMTYILINMFLTIVNEAFKVVNNDISKQSNEFEMVDFMMKRLKLWTGIGKAPTTGNGKNQEGDQGPEKEQDIVDEFPEKVDQLLNSIAKIYFNHKSFDDVIRGMGHDKKKKKKGKKTISV
ncbi:uncharacterized protein LOC117292387 [Asterias rubens]|uniref:uncharacterized protein LOC117292387 n=1 Tax=Asterias rubens TaxID=7604 RepID=UPI001454F08E|nr:uncharacterized protein LOC117292387 [Asterias rubens]